MSLKYIVPTLGLVAASFTPTFAADVGGGLQVGGYVDAILAIESLDDGIAPLDNAGDPDGTQVDFTSTADINVGYNIGSDVRAYVELGFNGDNSDVDLQEAYAEWKLETVSLTMGKFHSHLSYEGNDAPELNRVNTSIVYNMFSGENNTGLAVGFKPSDTVDVGVYLVDSFFGEVASKEGTDLGVGASVTFKVAGIGWFDVDLAYDMAATGTVAEPEDLLVFGINGEIDSLKESSNLLLAFDLSYADAGDVSAYGLMLMANYGLSTSFPSSATLMVSYLEPDGDTDDDEEMEIAVAWLSNPTNDNNFALNLEARMIDRAAEESSEFGIFVEALAVIP
jgi:hypothetical protein